MILSTTDLNEFVAPSLIALAQFSLLIASFLIGHHSIAQQCRFSSAASPVAFRTLNFNSRTMRVTIYGSSLGCLLLLSGCLFLSGAFSTTFLEYFGRVRVDYEVSQSLTGIHFLDVLTKVLAFPLSYTIVLATLGNEMRHCKLVLWVCIVNLLLFCYLWQVNYPLIYLSWLFIFTSLISGKHGSGFYKKSTFSTILLICLLLGSAANRFGGDVTGGIQRYIVGYHLIGFSFYDSQYHNTHSLVHSLSYGRSSLGFLDQIFEAMSKFSHMGYKAASSENSTYLNDAIDIGRDETREVNAFGTILFTLYRDFSFPGIAIGGFLYGAMTTYFLYRSAQSWKYRAMFLFMASTWMVGMMVSPPEQAYFWFAVIGLNLIDVVSRGVKLSCSSQRISSREMRSAY